MDNSIYSDLDLSFNPNPITGDLMLVKNSVAVIRALRNLILTNVYEKPFNPEFGSSVRKLLFENMSPFIASTLSKELINTIQNYEPRVSIKQLTVTPDYDNNSYSVTIECYIKSITDPVTVGFLLYRLR